MLSPQACRDTIKNRREISAAWQRFGDPRRQTSRRPSALQQLSCFGPAARSASLAATATKREARDVDLALRLNVVAVFASFLLVGAILLGAF
jgi:hypothetical protein